ncbi:peptidoglycan binding protein [Liquorilactobacillus ghanensis DSM 18630]|uniref:Peptidoglycan binding protein n=1 Tax=Liquorilactobacillus ghanensis DSM 18630 TaxID=1423750 RepID=A0A0R1VGZ0_9LACO|nr:LysM peptidoglycan-binding domain-containing protein [Liquorilactobacillus ghanensis]KRM04840.1 peptidoglycan binding protein [Liquorilactobacillus ghanensis DSM 18630]
MDIKKILLSAATVTGMMAVGTVAANADTVTVKAGDTVSVLAHEYGTTVDTIKQSNQLQNENLIFVGQKLQINGTATTTNQVAPAVQQPATSVQSSTPSATQTQQPAQSTQSSTPAAAQSQQPAQKTQSSTPAAAQSQQPAQSTQSAPAAPAAKQTQQPATTTTNTTISLSDSSARDWIAARESGGSYTATNGNYYGKYQLSRSYLHGDYSAANQDRVANQYVAAQYGSWQGAVSHWKEYGWY